MPQARLPDINTAFIRFRNEALFALKQFDYSACFGSLYTFNGMLPELYRVSISTIEYEKLVVRDVFCYCTHCNVEHNFKSVQVLAVLVPLIVSTISGDDHQKIWVCTACKKENLLAQTKMSRDSPKEPYYLKVVPKPPERKDGLMDRAKYHIKVVQWAWTFINELEAQAALFRGDYKNEDDEFFDDDDLESDEFGAN